MAQVRDGEMEDPQLLFKQLEGHLESHCILRPWPRASLLAGPMALVRRCQPVGLEGNRPLRGCQQGSALRVSLESSLEMGSQLGQGLPHQVGTLPACSAEDLCPLFFSFTRAKISLGPVLS